MNGPPLAPAVKPSRGLGPIERRIGESFAATEERALTIADLCDHAFHLEGQPATPRQRRSAGGQRRSATVAGSVMGGCRYERAYPAPPQPPLAQRADPVS